MPIHVFVDETKSRGLLMAAARCPAGDVAVNRKALRGLLLPGQERLHFNHEKPAERLVVELEESTAAHDRRWLRDATRLFSCHETLRWDVLPAKSDPLLWVPDAVAWSWMRGSDWRRAVAPFCQLREL